MKKLWMPLAFALLFIVAACGPDTSPIEEMDYPVEYETGTITEASDEGAMISIIIEVEGFEDTIRATVVVDQDHNVVSMDITDHNETEGWGQDAIEDQSFIDDIIENQDDLDTIDVYSGATVTSEALFDIVRTAHEFSREVQ